MTKAEQWVYTTPTGGGILVTDYHDGLPPTVMTRPDEADSWSAPLPGKWVRS